MVHRTTRTTSIAVHPIEKVRGRYKWDWHLIKWNLKMKREGSVFFLLVKGTVIVKGSILHPWIKMSLHLPRKSKNENRLATCTQASSRASCQKHAIFPILCHAHFVFHVSCIWNKEMTTHNRPFMFRVNFSLYFEASLKTKFLLWTMFKKRFSCNQCHGALSPVWRHFVTGK